MTPPQTQARRNSGSEKTNVKADRAGEQALSWLARTGLAARGVFYCMLVYLVAQLAAGGGKQANAHGALTTVASRPGGFAALAVTAAAFVAFGAARIWGAIREQGAKLGQRSMTFVQGAFYIALAWVPLSYALGDRSAGSEQQHQKTATGLLRLPGGRELLFALGLVIVGVCVHQFWNGVDQKYTDGMDTKNSPTAVKVLVRASGTVGIPARAAVFFPTGIFFMIAAVQSDPKHADGLDKQLATLAHHTWGIAVLALVAFGLAIFALYSFLEARYRTVTKGK